MPELLDHRTVSSQEVRIKVQFHLSALEYNGGGLSRSNAIYILIELIIE